MVYENSTKHDVIAGGVIEGNGGILRRLANSPIWSRSQAQSAHRWSRDSCVARAARLIAAPVSRRSRRAEGFCMLALESRGVGGKAAGHEPLTRRAQAALI